MPVESNRVDDFGPIAVLKRGNKAAHWLRMTPVDKGGYFVSTCGAVPVCEQHLDNNAACIPHSFAGRLRLAEGGLRVLHEALAEFRH